MNILAHTLKNSKKTSLESFFSNRNEQGSFFKPFIQRKLAVNEPGDAYEQEADAVADKVMRMSDPSVSEPINRVSISSLQRKCAACEEDDKMHRKEASNTGGSMSAPPIVSDVLSGSGKPLDKGTQQFMESRMGQDFSNVRIHTDGKAAESAQSINALAYTSGHNIVFNNGQYQPDTEGGKRLLAHELVHVGQQKGDIKSIQRVNPKDCSKDCSKPDRKTAKKSGYKLTIFADKEGPFLLIPLTSNVGHSWLELIDKDGNLWTYGFWPQSGFDPSNKKADVEGCVHHPDLAHSPTSSQSYELTESEFKKALNFAQTQCTNKPKYNLFGLQCTQFVLNVLKEINKAPDSGFGLIWESPGALDSWIKTNDLLLGAKFSLNLENPTNVDITATAQYRHQFYSMFSNKLKLQLLANAELGSKVRSISAGGNIAFKPNNVYIPSIYISGEGTLGHLGITDIDRFGGGVKGSAGLNFPIDQLGFIQVEYSVTKDIVNNDPLLHQLSLKAGIKLW